MQYTVAAAGARGEMSGTPAEKARGLAAGAGLDAATGGYKDLIKAGIIDPAEVTRSALQNGGTDPNPIAAGRLPIRRWVPRRVGGRRARVAAVESPRRHGRHRVAGDGR
jgi:hypothetical protein